MDVFKKIIEDTTGVQIDKLQKDDEDVHHANILDVEGDPLECQFIDDWVEINTKDLNYITLNEETLNKLIDFIHLSQQNN